MKKKNAEFDNFDAVMHQIIKAPHAPITKKKPPKKRASKASDRASGDKG